MYCQNCGVEINEEQKICLNCGGENPNFKKICKSKKKWIIASVVVISTIILIRGIISNNEKVERHKELIQQVSTTQLDLYQHKLIPTLMGDNSYSVKDVKCSEVSPEGKAQYAIGLDCNIIIGDKTFQYPVAVLFNDDNVDNPQYVHDTGIEKQIIDYEKEYKTEQEKKNKLNQIIKISAKDLYNAYDKNEVDADNKYTGKTGIISGKITGIDVGYDGNPIVSLDGDEYLSEVTCVFADKSQSKQISKLKKGQVVVIKGRIVGKNIAVIRVEDCALQ